MFEARNEAKCNVGDHVWYYDDSSILRSGRVHGFTDNGTSALIYEDGPEHYQTCVPAKFCWPMKWIAVYMEHIQYIISAMLTFLAWGAAWVALEVVIYGQPENRTVDNIICLPVLIVLYFLFKFKRERDRLRQHEE